MSQNLHFLKMSGVGNDFIIIDARSSSLNALESSASAAIAKISSWQISKLCNRKNIGCDQLVIIKNSDKADCLMDIFNQDGTRSGACGNATRCVALIIMEEKNVAEITIETAAGLLKCKRIMAAEVTGSSAKHNSSANEISVEMGIPVFAKSDFYFDDIKFSCVDMGNPHAVCFVKHIPTDEVFFKIGPEIENHKFFPQKTNVEFARIISVGEISSDNINSAAVIEVRVFERGAGETLACGSGACAVAALAIKHNLVKSKKIITRFKGGDLTIEWSGEGSKIIMTGDCTKIFSGVIDAEFLA